MRLIDADALIEDIDGDLTDGIAEGRAIEKIMNAPTIEPEQKTGKWILADTYDGRKRYRCSECLAFAPKTDDGKENLSDYCPVCGARMEGEDDGTD